MPSSEHVYCVAIAFKMTEHSNKSASNFVLSLNIPLWKVFGWLRRPQLWATVTGSFITTMCLLMHHISCRVFWQHIKSSRWLSPLQPRFSVLWLLAFCKIKITFEREDISDYWWDSGKYDRAADGDGENYMRSQGAYFKGDWGVIVLCTVFLVSRIFFNKCLYFSYYMAGYLLERPHILYVIVLYF